MTALALAMALLLLGQAPQTPTEDRAPLRLQVGTRLRVSTAVRGEHLEGAFLTGDSRRITLAIPGPEPYSLPGEMTLNLDPTTRVQVHQGRKRHTLLGAAVGAVAFGLMGAGVSVNETTCNLPDSTAFCSRGEAMGAMAFVGAGVGALVGYAVQTDRWSAPIVIGPPLRPESPPPQRSSPQEPR